MNDLMNENKGKIVKVKIGNKVIEGLLFQDVDEPYVELPGGKKFPVSGPILESLKKQVKTNEEKEAANQNQGTTNNEPLEKESKEIPMNKPEQEQKQEQEPEPAQRKEPVQRQELAQKQEKEQEPRQAPTYSMEEREAMEKNNSDSSSPASQERLAAEIRKKHKAAEDRHKEKIDAKAKKRIKAEEKAAKKIAKRKEKAMSQITGDADGYNPEQAKKKKMIISSVYIVAIIAVLIAAKLVLNFQQDEIAVIRLKSDKLAGETIDSSDIEEFKMLRKTYDELGTVNYTDADGKSSVKQVIYKWEDKDQVVDKYIANYTQGGQYLTLKNVTDKKVVRNPWLAEVKEGQEIYTLPIQTEGVNTRLLLPGTHLRVRVVVQMDDTTNPFKHGNAATPETGGVVSGTTNELNKNALASSGSEVPTASVVFDDLVAIDMLNSSNESLFDIYMALYKLSVEERISYLETTIEDGNAQEFQKRVMPTSLVLILNKSQATQMAEFENLSGATIKYTILPYTDDNGNLLSNFTEIANQMNEIIEKANY